MARQSVTSVALLVTLLLAGHVSAGDEEPTDIPTEESMDEGLEEPILEPAGEPDPAVDPEPAAVDPFDLEDHDDGDPVWAEPSAPALPADLPDGRPFAKGDMELGLGLGGMGGSESFALAVGGSFAYYFVDRLAPGIDLQYNTVFHDRYDFPDSITTLPFLKFVILRERKFAPFLILTGGREFQWGGSTNPFKGIRATDAWILGGGAGVHIGVGEHLAIRLQILALHYWYDGARIRGFDDKVFDGPHSGDDDDGLGRYVIIEENGKVGCDPAAGDCFKYYESDDWKDTLRELFFPMIHIGLAFTF